MLYVIDDVIAAVYAGDGVTDAGGFAQSSRKRRVKQSKKRKKSRFWIFKKM